MFQIVGKSELTKEVKSLKVLAPLIAKKAFPGQFIILRIDEKGERIPLTIAEYDREAGTITIIFQLVGKTTRELGDLKIGDYLSDFVGPLGKPSLLDATKKVCVIGGGLGTAIAYPQAKALYAAGGYIDVIAGFRNKEMVILEDELCQNATNVFITTDDGSYKRKGFVSDVLKELIEKGNKYDEVIAIGPLIMMKVVTKVTREYHIPTIVSMNSIMLDGTGMCGACRLTVNGETKFACVDGPEFDGHLVDFDEAMRRCTIYKDLEKQSLEKHECRLMGGAR